MTDLLHSLYVALVDTVSDIWQWLLALKNTLSSDAADTLSDVSNHIAATFAFVIGAFWVAMNYVRNRTHGGGRSER